MRVAVIVACILFTVSVGVILHALEPNLLGALDTLYELMLVRTRPY